MRIVFQGPHQEIPTATRWRTGSIGVWAPIIRLSHGVRLSRAPVRPPPKSTCQGAGRLMLPGASREVGNGDGRAAFGDTGDAEWHDAAPSGGIIDGQVQGQALPQALNQSPVHHVIHTAVATGRLGLGVEFLPERVAILLMVGLQICDPALRLAVEMQPRRVVAEGARSAGDQIDATVRTGLDQRELNHDGATQCGLDERGIDIAAGKALPAARVVSREGLTSAAQCLLARTHREEVIESVAGMDAHVLGHWAESVSRVKVAVPGADEATAPGRSA